MNANARFWIYENGSSVKLTLKPNAPHPDFPGSALRWATGGPNEEGWSASGWSFYLVGDTVVHEYWSDGRDCDGRLETHGRVECHRNNLAAREVDGEAELFPEWETIESGRRDHTAEAAGY